VSTAASVPAVDVLCLPAMEQSTILNRCHCLQGFCLPARPVPFRQEEYQYLGTARKVNYTYKVQATDAIPDVIAGLANAMNTTNGGDPNALATAYDQGNEVVLTSKIAGGNGNNIAYSTMASSGAQVTATAADVNLTGGGDAAQVAPGTLVSNLRRQSFGRYRCG
jgi:hypothetical protein